jgi:hypothetical protein
VGKGFECAEWLLKWDATGMRHGGCSVRRVGVFGCTDKPDSLRSGLLASVAWSDLSLTAYRIEGVTRRRAAGGSIN